MSLFDEMNKKKVEETPQEEVQQAPVTPPKEKEKPSDMLWWQTPDFYSALNARVADAEKRAELEMKKARRQRNLAILGDLAKLGAQMYAKGGGAWKIDQFTPATEKANDKLAALRERHAAEVAAFAKERAAAEVAMAKDNNEKMKVKINLDNAEKKEATRQKERKEDVAFRNKREERLKNQGATGNASDDEIQKAYDEYYDNLSKGYDVQVKEPVAERDEEGDYVIGPDGKMKYQEQVVMSPNLNQIRSANAKAKSLKKRGLKSEAVGPTRADFEKGNAKMGGKGQSKSSTDFNKYKRGYQTDFSKYKRQ